MKEKNNQPLVSIICLCWNHENYLVQCLQSIVSQSYTNIEIIFIDNNSTDASVLRAKEFLTNSFENYLIINRTENNGISNNLNHALSKCNGKYLIAISTDDWLTLDSVKKKVDFMENSPNCALVYSNGFIYYEKQNITINHIIKNPKQGKVFNNLLRQNFIFIIGAMLNIKMLNEVGRYNENSPIEDWEISLRLSNKYEIGYINEQLAFYRKHDNNISNKLNTMLKNEIIILNNYGENFNAKIGIIKAYKRYFQLSILKKLSSLSFYSLAKDLYHKIK